jgi:hypothetical protein
MRELIKEAEDCDRKLPQSSGKMSDEQEAKIFSNLILQGDCEKQYDSSLTGRVVG